MAPRRIVRPTFAILLFVAGVAITLGASLFAAYGTARLSSHIGVLLMVAFAVCFLLAYAVASVATKLWGAKVRWFAITSSAIVTALFAVAVFLLVLRPSNYPHITPVARANTQYWSLPSGSRAAYSVYEPPAGVAVKRDPIVFLHGGPGLRATDSDHQFYSQFAGDGFRVYLFDQAGSGLSDRLPHATDYTVERFVTDLEEIRQKIGAERLILIGHSWGGTLAAHYAAAYPEHVAKLVFHSPGEPWIEKFVPFEDKRTAEEEAGPVPPPRMLAAIGLSYANPAASEDLVSQSELGDWELATVDPRELVCKGAAGSLPRDFSGQGVSGMNMYPILVTVQELKQKKMDIRTQLESLHVPAIALEGECDFIPWAVHSMYKKTIPGLQEFYFPGAGHEINLSRPEQLASVLRAFLLDQPPPFAAYTGDSDPRPPLGKKAKR